MKYVYLIVDPSLFGEAFLKSTTLHMTSHILYDIALVISRR